VDLHNTRCISKPSFNTLQNHAAGAALHFFVFDLLVLPVVM
jgi:hypothetical protein